MADRSDWLGVGNSLCSEAKDKLTYPICSRIIEAIFVSSGVLQNGPLTCFFWKAHFVRFPSGLINVAI